LSLEKLKVGNKAFPEKGKEILAIFPKWDKIKNAPCVKKKTC
jgi:hypothetical protein